MKINTNLEKLAMFITKKREEMELTQEEFGKMFNVSERTIYNWENCSDLERKPRLLDLVALQKMFNIASILDMGE